MKRKVLARSLETRARILDAAEVLFAEKGLEYASMRGITTAAQVNLAAVNYHFGSKEGLVVAVYVRRLRPVSAERLQMLDSAERRTTLKLEDVLLAYIAPVLRLLHDPKGGGDVFIRLLARALYEPGAYLAQLYKEEMEPMLARFQAALARCLPKLSSEELFWRLHFAGGSIAYTLAQVHRLDAMAQAVYDPKEVENVISRLVDFTAAGMRGEHDGRTFPEPHRGEAKIPLH